jgi:hypothetical protein
MKHIFKILVLSLLFLLPRISITNAVFSSQATITNNTVTTGFWETLSCRSITLPETSLDFYLREDKKAVGFKVAGSDLATFDSLDYLITYDSDQTEQGITGTRVIGGANEITEDDLLLGYCTTGGTCVYFTGVTTINITVTLHGSTDKVLTQEITL